MECGGSSTNTITIATNATVAIPLGSLFEGHQDDIGQMQFALASGVNAYTPMGTKTRTQGSPFYFYKMHTDAWMITGDLVP
jgi:hypothetical protein